MSLGSLCVEHSERMEKVPKRWTVRDGYLSGRDNGRYCSGRFFPLGDDS